MLTFSRIRVPLSAGRRLLSIFIFTLSEQSYDMLLVLAIMAAIFWWYIS
ncbi:hypothetical protein XIS1_600009 [Xenorhabdus innexi]|uniref:Uncharacterized protein n=1 Tax=Xenorhabdus innexi TaxID=290109 RepID=A0A1N6MZD1_9GAMM|nr:hypothetical protein XIS1_600009 [Xenorhabdus innexi]